jgi:hypothetical protein
MINRWKQDAGYAKMCDWSDLGYFNCSQQSRWRDSKNILTDDVRVRWCSVQVHQTSRCLIDLHISFFFLFMIKIDFSK